MHDIQTLIPHKYMGEWHTWLGVYMNYLNAYILAAVVLGVIAYNFIGKLYLTVKVIKISHSLFTVWYINHA